MTLGKYFTWFKEDWQKVGAIVCIFLTIYLVVIVLPQSTVLFALLLSTPLYMLHEIEEYIYPGGFADFVNLKVFKTGPEDGILDTNAVFWINMVVWIAMPLFSLWAIYDIRQAIALPYFFIFQAAGHLILGIVGKRFLNPGMVSAWLVHVPWAIWTIGLLGQEGAITNPYWNPGLREGLLIVVAMMLANRILVARFRRRQKVRIQS